MEIARISDVTVPALPHTREADMVDTGTRVGFMEKPLPMRSALPLRAGLAGLLAIGVVLLVIGWRMSRVDPIQASGEAPATVVAQPEAIPSGQPTHVPLAVLGSPAANPDLVLNTERLGRGPSQRVQPETEAVVPMPVEPAPAPQPQRTVRAKPVQTGTINLVTRGGWAKIYEGKRSLGSTPRKLRLSAGRHKLVLRPFGTGEPKTVWVDVASKKTRKVSVSLD